MGRAAEPGLPGRWWRALVLLTSLLASVPTVAADWAPRAWADASTIELRTVAAGSGPGEGGAPVRPAGQAGRRPPAGARPPPRARQRTRRGPRVRVGRRAGARGVLDPARRVPAALEPEACDVGREHSPADHGD